MAKVELVSFLTSLNGHLGNSVYYTVGKKVYVRRYVKPSNPRSEAQQSHRSLFAEAMALWKLLSADEKLQYKKKSKNLAMHGHNLFIREYIKLNKDTAELKSVQSPETSISTGNSSVNQQARTSSEATLYLNHISSLSPYIQSISSPG